MIRSFNMNNLTLIILVSFSLLNILYMGSDLFARKSKKPSTKFREYKKEALEQPDCKKCHELLSCQSQKNEKIVRKTKTSSKSEILGNGDLVEETTVTEVIETITHTGHVEEDNGDCASEDEATSLYHDCLETCKAKSKETEKDKWSEKPLSHFGCKPLGFVDNIDETIEIKNASDSKHKVEENKVLEQSISNSTDVNESSEPSTTNENADTSEDQSEEKPAPPNIQLPTGLPCCLSRLVSSAFRSWTFYLSGLIMDIPLFCTDRCLYTRANDSSSYCFSTDKSTSCTSCTTNITTLMRLHTHNFRVELDDLKTKAEILAERKAVPVMKLSNKIKPDATSCCPVKQVVGEESSSDLFVLRGKTPDRRNHCSDNCIYMKVGDVQQIKYCFGIGNFGTACHQNVPSISILLNRNTTLREVPLRLDEVVTKSTGHIGKTQGEEKSVDVDEVKKKDNIKQKKKEEGNVKTEFYIPVLLKKEPVAIAPKQTPKKVDMKGKIEDKKAQDIMENDGTENKKIFIHNGFKIQKIMNVENKIKPKDLKVGPTTINKHQDKNNQSIYNNKDDVTIDVEQNETNTFKTKESYLKKSKPEHKQDLPNEAKTVPVCPSKCVDGMKVKRIRIDINEKPLSLKPTKSQAKFEEPIKINCGVGLPVKLIKIPERKEGKPPVKKLIDSTTSSKKSRNGFGPSFFELNKSRMKIQTNGTSEKNEHNNKVSKKKEMASSEGIRTLPYKITLIEKPKLITQTKDSKSLDGKSVKAEIPIQIACCTGKPYKINPENELMKKHCTLKYDDEEERNICIHNGIQTIKKQKKENVENQSKPDDLNVIPSVRNKQKIENKQAINDNQSNVNIYSEQNQTTSLKTKENKLNKSNEGQTVLVCSSTYVNGIEMKMIKIIRNEEPLGIKSKESPVKIGELFKEPLKVYCGMKLIKIPEKKGLKKELNTQANFEEEKRPSKICNSKQIDARSQESTSPFKLKKNVLLLQNETDKKPKIFIKKEDPDSKPAITSTTSITKIKDGFNLIKLNKTKLNKTRTKHPTKYTTKKSPSDKKYTKITEMASSEGKRIRPYRITLTERPKLINRTKDAKQLADNLAKAEIPIQIACCTGKPYKLKTVNKMKVN